MAVTQANLDTFHALVEADGSLTNAQKAQVQAEVLHISTILFGGNSASTIPATIGGKSGKLDGRLG